MDKLFNNNWFIKIISFFIAFMLFLMVNIDQFENQPGSVFPPGTTATYSLEDVELHAYYDEDLYAITEMAESVQVNVSGPQGAITLLQLTRPSYEVFVDLQGKEAGVHHVSIQHKGFPRELSVSIVPQFIKVVLQEKKTISIPVEVDVVNRANIAEGYTVGTSIVNPVNVEITAAEELIDSIAIAKAYVDVEGESRTLEKSAPVKVYDHLGNELQLVVEPSVVDVRIPITSPNKKVPIKITREGELPEELSISSITVDPKEVTIYGPKNVMDTIELLEGVILDLGKVEEEQTFELQVPKPTGVEKVDPETVSVTVELSREETVTMADINIEILGLAEGFVVEKENPELNQTNVLLKGAKPLIDKMKREEVQAIIDVSELAIGEHEVPIQIIGPQYVTFDPEIKSVKITITEQQ